MSSDKAMKNKTSINGGEVCNIDLHLSNKQIRVYSSELYDNLDYSKCKFILEAAEKRNKKEEIQKILYRMCKDISSLGDFPFLFSKTVRYDMVLNDLLQKKWKKYVVAALEKCSNFTDYLEVCRSAPFDSNLLKKVYEKTIENVTTFKDACLLMRYCILYDKFHFVILDRMLSLSVNVSEVSFVYAISANCPCIHKKAKARAQELSKSIDCNKLSIENFDIETGEDLSNILYNLR